MRRIILTLLLLLLIATGTLHAQAPIGGTPRLFLFDEFRMGEISCPSDTKLVVQVISHYRAWVSCPPGYFIAQTPTATQPPSPILPTVTPTPLPIIVFSLQPNAEVGIDTYITENSPTARHGTKTNIRLVARPAFRANSLLYFDVSSIPAGSIVVSATLTLHSALTTTQDIPFSLHTLLEFWTETATWNNPQPEIRWTGDLDPAGGIDAGSSIVGIDYNEQLLGYGIYAANTPARTAYAINLDASQVQAWLGGGDNRGFVMRSNGDGGGDFYSSDAVDADMRPRLDVTYLEVD